MAHKIRCSLAPSSDHSPIILDTSPSQPYYRIRRFRFENKWLEEPDINRVVERSWDGFSDCTLLDRLRATSGVLEDWGRHIAMAAKRNRQDLENEIKALQVESSTQAGERLNEAKKELSTLFVKEELYWRQRAKAHWLTGGDLNTRFFHQMASARKKSNTIHGLFSDDGRWVTDKSGLHGIVSEYFSTLFTASDSVHDIEQVTQHIRGSISSDENNYLIRDFEEEEFKVAVKQMHKDKAPGPDGFNPGFYKRFWGKVGGDVAKNCIS